MPTTTCPFCGVVSDERHDTQQACIEALQGEIARTRGILDKSLRPGDAPPALAGPDEASENEQ